MGYVFISYSTINQQAADSAKHLLNNNGIDTWMAPYDIPPGSEYASVISNALKDCSCLVFLFTNASQDSRWVRKELERAINYNKVIIPLKLEEVEMNSVIEFYLADFQVVPVRKMDDSSPEIQRILSRIKSFTEEDDIKVGDVKADLPKKELPPEKPKKEKPKNISKPKKPINKKALIISFIVALVIAIAVAFGVYAKTTGMFNKIPPNTYHATLKLSDEISVSDYNSNIEILEDRAENFSGDEKYLVDTDKDNNTVDLYLPVSKFGDTKAESIIETFFADKVEYRLADVYDNYKSTFQEPISNDDIESIVLKNGTIKGAEKQEKEPYDYFEIKFTDEFINKNKSKMQSTKNDLAFKIVDRTVGSYTWAKLYPVNDNTFCISAYDNSLENELFIYNLTHQSLTCSFEYEFDYNYLADWQDVTKASVVGKNQCNFDDFDTPSVTFAYASSEILDQGQALNTETVLKKRLDILGTPYAFGTYTYDKGDKDSFDNQNYFIIKTSPKYVSFPILSMMVVRYGLSVKQGAKSTSISLGDYWYKLSKVEDGNNFSIVFENQSTSDFDDDENFAKSKSDKLYLTSSNFSYIDAGEYPLLCADTNKISADGKKIVFDKLCQVVNGEYKYSKLDKNCLFIYDLLESISNEKTDYEYLNLQHFQENKDKGGNLPKPEDYTFTYDAKNKELENVIIDICPTAEFEYIQHGDEPTLDIYLGLNEDENLVDTAIDYVEKIYNSFDFENSCYGSIDIRFLDKDAKSESVAYCSMSKWSKDGIRFYTNFRDGRVEKYKKDYKKKIESSNFVKDNFFLDEKSFYYGE